MGYCCQTIISPTMDWTRPLNCHLHWRWGFVISKCTCINICLKTWFPYLCIYASFYVRTHQYSWHGRPTGLQCAVRSQAVYLYIIYSTRFYVFLNRPWIVWYEDMIVWVRVSWKSLGSWSLECLDVDLHSARTSQPAVVDFCYSTCADTSSKRISASPPRPDL